MPYPNLTEHEAKQFERDFWDNIGCAPEEYVRIRRAIRLLEALSRQLERVGVPPLPRLWARCWRRFGNKGLCLLEFVGQKHMEQEIAAVQKALRGRFVFREDERTQLLRQEFGLILQMPSENLCHALGNDWYGVSKQAGRTFRRFLTAKRAVIRSRRSVWATPKLSAPLPLPTGRTRRSS